MTPQNVPIVASPPQSRQAKSRGARCREHKSNVSSEAHGKYRSRNRSSNRSPNLNPDISNVQTYAGPPQSMHTEQATVTSPRRGQRGAGALRARRQRTANITDNDGDLQGSTGASPCSSKPKALHPACQLSSEELSHRSFIGSPLYQELANNAYESFHKRLPISSR